MKTFEFIQATSGLTPLHVIFLFLGAFAYIMDKYLEQYNKFKLEGKTLFFAEFIKDPNTYVSGLLTMILSFMATVGIVYEIPDHDVLTAVSSGGMSYSGYAFLRQRMKSMDYSKQFKQQQQDGPDNGN